MYLKTRTLFSDKRANLKHVSLKNRALGTVKVEGVILKERATAVKTLAHVPECAVKSSRLPVALSTETVTFGHEALRCKTGNLIETYKLGIVDVLSTEVVEVGSEALCTLGSED